VRSDHTAAEVSSGSDESAEEERARRSKKRLKRRKGRQRDERKASTDSDEDEAGVLDQAAEDLAGASAELAVAARVDDITQEIELEEAALFRWVGRGDSLPVLCAYASPRMFAVSDMIVPRQLGDLLRAWNESQKALAEEALKKQQEVEMEMEEGLVVGPQPLAGPSTGLQSNYGGALLPGMPPLHSCWSL
jgi:hypothetical protein